MGIVLYILMSMMSMMLCAYVVMWLRKAQDGMRLVRLFQRFNFICG